MKTFNGDKKLKAELVKELKHHQKLDAFIQGSWLTKENSDESNFKGCFYGCTMQSEDNPIQKFSDKYNIDLWFCHLTEKLFEGLPNREYQDFPLKSIQLLPIGLDLNKLKSKFHYALLMDEKMGQINYCGDNEKCRKAIIQCAELFKVNFDKIDESAAGSARSAAESAAESAAGSARSARSAESIAWSARSARSAESAAESAAGSARSAESIAWSAAESAAWSARSAAESAAWSARSAAESIAWSARSAESAAESAAGSARSEYYVWMRDLLFKLLKESK